MGKGIETAHYLLEGMLDGGLSFVGSYLGRKIGQPVIIADEFGKVYYPETSSETINDENQFVDLPGDSSEKYLYNTEQKRLFYSVHHNKNRVACVKVENVPAEKAEQILAIIGQADLALKYHFSRLAKEREDLAESLWEHFFLSEESSIPDKLRQFEEKMDINNYYFVFILDVEVSPPKLDWRMLRSNAYERIIRTQAELICSIISSGRLVNIVRGFPKKRPTDIDPDWTGRDIIETTIQEIEEKFKIEVSVGIGRAYRPSELLKSYREACVALTLPRLSEKKRFIQFFSQMGVFSVLFSLDTDTLKDYCLQALGKVIEHDEKRGTDFLGTLRILLENECSWTTTANQLYIHVNTVYYRMLKVEQLLGIDFSLFETRLHLFTAIRAWDTLRTCKFVE